MTRTLFLASAAALFAAALAAAPAAAQTGGGAPTVAAKPSQDPQTRALAEQVLRMTGPAEGFIQDVDARIWPMLADAIKSANPGIEAAVLADLKQQYVALVRQSVERLYPGLIDIYTRYFTLDEMKAILAFQTSPVGRKLLGLMPQIMGEMMPILEAHAQKAQPEIMQQFRSRLDAQGLRN